jgi:hypothetical protein
MTRLVFLLLAFAAFGLTLHGMGRREPPVTAKSFAVEQGVAGKVEIWEGNFMPMVNGPPRGKITPAAGRRVRVHEPLNVLETGSAMALHDTILTAQIAETRTDTAGQYFLPLPVGRYSIFVEEDSGWYFNGWDGEGFQGLIQIDSVKVTTQDIRILTKAVF